MVGSVVADAIRRPDGRLMESLGGISYSVAVLAALAGDRIRIQPICRVGRDLWATITEAWSSLPGVTVSSLIRDRRRNPRNELTYAAGAPAADRRERLSEPLPPLSEDDVSAALGADLVLVNCITGADCTLAALEAIGRSCRRVYLDLHSLALGRAADGSRYYRRPDQWERWIGSADVVQCNRAEAATLAGMDPYTADPEMLESFLERQLVAAERPGAGRPTIFALTDGAEGAAAYWIRRGRIQSSRVAAAAVEAIDPTGAGDAFGAGYAVAWLDGASAAEAVERGVRTGTAACMISGIPEPAGLRQALRELPR